MNTKEPQYIAHNGRANMSRFFDDMEFLLMGEDGSIWKSVVHDCPSVSLMIVAIRGKLKFKFFEN